MRTLLLALLTFAALAARADTVEIDDVKYEPTVGVAGKELRLNGAATRRNPQGVRNFAVAVYLQAPAKTAEALLAAPGPKRIGFKFLRTVQADALRFLTQSVQGNVERADFVKTFIGVMQLGELLGGRSGFVEGDSFSMDYRPGTGTVFLINGKPQGQPVKEPEFFKAMLLIWLGPRPVDPRMKTGLLAG